MEVYIVKRTWYDAGVGGDFPNTNITIHGINSNKEDAIKKFFEMRKNEKEWYGGYEIFSIYKGTMDEEYKEIDITKEVLEEAKKQQVDLDDDGR